MEQSGNISPADQICRIKGLLSTIRLAVKGIVTLNSAPTDDEEWGINLVLENIEDRLDIVDAYVCKAIGATKQIEKSKQAV